MNTNTKRTTALVTIAAVGGTLFGFAFGSSTRPATAQKLEDILVGGGLIVLVNNFNKPIDKFINGLTGNKPDGKWEKTKVVPIVTVGSGGYIGMVQVSGPAYKIDTVKAVGQVEGHFNISGREIRGKALVPITTTKPKDLKSISRVKGVGVSAIIDVEI